MFSEIFSRNKSHHFFLLVGPSVFLLFLCVSSFSMVRAEEGARAIRDIRQGWTLQAGESIHDVTVGVAWENYLGIKFDGLATYRAPLPEPSDNSRGYRLLEIDGAATEAKVSCDSQLLGTHLGAWTPFRVMLPREQNRESANGKAIEIELDERVGHNTQGFLPIVVPHFGGIWKHVRVIDTAGPLYFDDLGLMLSGFDGADHLTLKVSVRGSSEMDLESFEWGWRIVGPTEAVKTEWVWNALPSESEASLAGMSLGSDNQPPVVSYVEAKVTPPAVVMWSPDSPFLYEVELALRQRSTGELLDLLKRRAAFRTFRTVGRKLLVNDRPIVVRGLLNWGYAPPRLAPAISKEEMVQELTLAKELGFNLMKFCLWIPPREYFELADQMGMLTWVEYPTWHPTINDKTSGELKREFEEFFRNDRNYASVLLRSLTCETGHSASEDVIRELYDLAHLQIPGAIVEDDSSWIQWHRIHDFYDDHPYGNNHTWRSKLQELDDHINARDAKPLVLGEAIAADTWESIPVDDDFSGGVGEAHKMRSLDAQGEYLQRVISTHGSNTMEFLKDDSYQYAWAMRKYQIEAFRYMLPHSGYVVSVIRDFPLASMGLIDRQGNSKWDHDSFRWHQEYQLVLNEGAPVRAVEAGTVWEVPISVCAPSEEDREFLFQGEWSDVDTGAIIEHVVAVAQTGGDGKATSVMKLSVPSTDLPHRCRLSVRCTSNDIVCENAWVVWVVPQSDERDERDEVRWIRHSSITDATLARLGIPEGVTIPLESVKNVAEYNGVIIASHWDNALLSEIERGASCIMLPDGGPGSFVVRDHWFLRGGPVISDALPASIIPRTLLRDLQPFDLAGPVMHTFPWIDKGTPYLSLWDNHDLTDYRTHSLVWGTTIGRGKLLVSTLQHSSDQSPAGPFVLGRFVELLRVIPDLPSLTLEDRKTLRSEFMREQVSLVDGGWKFRRASPSEDDESQLDWLADDVTSEDWQTIEITRHWDGQGHGDFDGWGYYRLDLTLPANFRNRPLYLCFTGADDHYFAYVDGQEIGSAGDPVKRETAFEMRTSHAIPQELTEDGKLSVAVKVLDWQGAGGIFRPVFLATEPLSSGTPLLVPITNDLVLVSRPLPNESMSTFSSHRRFSGNLRNRKVKEIRKPTNVGWIDPNSDKHVGTRGSIPQVDRLGFDDC